MSKTKKAGANPKVADKILKSLSRERSRQVVDFEAFKSAKENVAEEMKNLPAQGLLSQLHPVPGMYMLAQNHFSILFEILSQMRELRRFVNTIFEAEEEYMPQGPPMSPITGTCFFGWSSCDLIMNASRENLSDIIGKVAHRAGYHKSLCALFQGFSASRIGLYKHEGIFDECVKLREVGTDKSYDCIVSSGELGEKGDLWITRLLQPPTGWNKYAVFGTPYRLVNTTEIEWQSYLERTYPKIKAKHNDDPHTLLMKYGLDRRYWLEYLFEGYVNHTPGIIFIEGLPDIEESRPHSRANSFKI